MLGKILLAAGAWFAWDQYKKKQAGGAAGDAGDTKWGGGLYDVVSAYANGAKAGDEVPLIVLLHGNQSDPTKVLEAFPLERPAHVVAPVGRWADGSGRSYVDPKLAGVERDKALRDEATNLMKLVAEVIEDQKPVPPRAIVVGLDDAGAIAVLLGLADPLHVRYAWGTGPAVPPSWVPLGLPLLNNLQRPIVYKLSAGPSVVTDQETAKVATERKMDMRVTDGVYPNPLADWVMPELDPLVETP